MKTKIIITPTHYWTKNPFFVLRKEHDAEPVVVVTIIRVVVVTIGYTTVVSIVVPTTATKHTVTTF